MTHRKTNIESPDFTFIPGGLNIGAQIVVRGRVGCHQERFHINLQNAQDEGCDIAFHFNPRTAEQTVVRNSYSGGWQTEERNIPYFPFAQGSKFTVRFFVGPESYIVLVNCQYFIEYKHRLPYQNVRYLKLSEGAEYYECTIQNPCRLPFNGEFPGGLKMGRALKVQGFVHENASRFAINFNCDINGDIVGVHFNPRQDQNDVVLNTKDPSWQHEERGQGWFPFPRGQYFDVLFIANDGSLDIYVDEKLFTSYKFRIPPERILFLNIYGDVTLMDVVFIDPLPNDYIKVIPSGLEKNDLISVKGFFYPKGERFAINLINGTCLEKDIALHFNPRRGENTVVFNNQINGSWQNEERHPLPHQLQQKIPFEVEILNKTKQFKTYVNGHSFASFKARRNVEDIQGINVQGQAYIYEVKLLRRLDNPFVDRLPGSFQIGSWLKFIGTPKKHANRFHINLQCGDDPNYGCDIAFHFNPRFNEHCTVRNSLICGSWGVEERVQPDFPFKPKDRFEVIILGLPGAFKVFVNQKFYIDYAYRGDLSLITHVVVAGDCNFFEPEFS